MKKSNFLAEVGDYRKGTEVEQPTEADRRTMADLKISVDGEYYRYEELRLDLFSAAINYSPLKHSSRT